MIAHGSIVPAVGRRLPRAALNRSLTRRQRNYFLCKRVADVAMSVIALIALSPVLLLCALAVAADTPGPIWFSQLRTGRDGRRFRMYKFRTMVPNAEELKPQLAHLNVLPPPDFKIPNDPRITRVGRLLRKIRFDELPQLINVLRGDMSFVGPRPTSFESSSYDLWHMKRLEVAPGLTGLWQVRGRHHTTFDERLRLDLEYIAHMSMWFDLRILVRTARAVLAGSGE